MRNVTFWALLAVACSGEDPKTDTDTPNTDADADADADADSDSDADADCDAIIVGVEPTDGATLVPVDAPVVVSFSSPISGADPFSIEIEGLTGTSTLAPDGLSASWDGTLDTDMSYTLNASVCGDASTTTFTTLPAGIDPADLVGNTYGVPWADLTVTNPALGNALFHSIIPIDSILAQVLTVDEVTNLADAVATVTSVDPNTGLPVIDCVVATHQTADFSLNPYFSIDGTIELVLDEYGNTVEIEDFSLLARVSDDAQSLTDIRVSGLIATENVLNGADCSTFGFLMAMCEPCLSSIETGYCMLLEANAPLAPIVPLDVAGTCGI